MPNPDIISRPFTAVGMKAKRARTSTVIPPDYVSRTCIAIFPEELWELILDKIPDSLCILNVFAAFPELDVLLHGQKTRWLFDQVFPHIIKQWQVSRKQTESVLRCRVVCRRWCNTVDEFLQNHPSRRLCSLDGINRRNESYGEFTYTDDLPYTHNFYGTDMIRRKYESDIMRNPKRNPFFSGRVSLWNHLVGNRNNEFLDACMVFLEKFGHYIHDLELELDTSLSHRISNHESELLILKILKCLSFVPTIRHLTIEFRHEDADGDIIEDLEDSKFANFPFPPLPYLTSLNIWGHNSITMGNILSLKYDSVNLRNLGVPMFCLQHDKFKHLLQLTVDIGNMGDGELQYYSLDIDAFPSLKKITITGTDAKYNISELFSQLAGASIEELQISGCEIIESTNFKLSPIRSIKYFRISDSLNHGFDFIRALTSLQYLQLDWHDAYDLRDTSSAEEILSYCTNPSEFTNNVRRYMYQSVVPETSHIWNELPMLRLLTVAKNANKISVTQYARECGNKPFRFESKE